MPPWSSALAEVFPKNPELRSESAYRAWFLSLCGILGDPLKAKTAQVAAIEAGVRIANPYSYKPAFKNSPGLTDLRLLHDVLMYAWGRLPDVLDPAAGGGSIPYEAIRYGLPTIGNDLNSVAAAILRAGVQIPAGYGPELTDDLRMWGTQLADRVTQRLAGFFPSGRDEQVATFLFARTVACPRTGKPVPLSPNWWLSKDKGGVAVRLVTEQRGKQLDQVEFEIVTGMAIDFDPDKGTVAGGNGISPWDGLAIDGDHIKAEAQAGRMGSQLYAVAVRVNRKRGFRAATRTDLDALAAAEKELAARLPGWLSTEIVPREEIPVGNKTLEPQRYGMTHWMDLFSPRQLLVHGTFVEEFKRIVPEVRAAMDKERADAVLALLGMMQGKALNYNSRMSVWHPTRNSMANTFDRHDFAFKWSHGEFEGARELYPWCLEQLLDAYEGIAKLLEPPGGRQFLPATGSPVPGPITVMKSNAGDLRAIPDKSQTLVCIDPPTTTTSCTPSFPTSSSRGSSTRSG